MKPSLPDSFFKTIFVFTGLPGSGKSYQSSRFANHNNLNRIGSDEIRKEFFSGGIAELKYHPETSVVVFEILFLRAITEVLQGKSVVLDGVFYHPQGWARLQKIQTEHNAQIYFVLLEEEEATLRKRVQARIHDPFQSEADLSILERFLSKPQAMQSLSDNASFLEQGFSWVSLNFEKNKLLKASSVESKKLGELILSQA